MGLYKAREMSEANHILYDRTSLMGMVSTIHLLFAFVEKIVKLSAVDLIVTQPKADATFGFVGSNSSTEITTSKDV